VRARLDPLGLDAAPPVVAVADLITDGQPLSEWGVRRLRLVLEHREMRTRLGELEAIVAGQVLSAFRDAEAIRVDTLRRLALAAEYRDDNSPEHTQRVGALAARMARHMGESDRMVWLVRQAAPLHDLGKIAIPDHVLLKPGRLTSEEYEVVKTHAVLGARVLAGGESDLLQAAERVARSHHERWDGSGYPDGLAGEAIPLEGRLVHVADVFDVLVHERPYKESWTVEAAAEEIRRGAGTHFDPEVVRAFEALGAAAWQPQPAG
jgi:putative two-component system response regulator